MEGIPKNIQQLEISRAIIIREQRAPFSGASPKMRSRTGWYVTKHSVLLCTISRLTQCMADKICCSLTCRARKLKCDERRPRCQNCQKAKRECRPSDGIVFRHQQNASMNGTSSGGGGNGVTGVGNLPGFYSYKNTFSSDSVWLKIPKKGNFLLLPTESPSYRCSHLRRCYGSICRRPCRPSPLLA